MPLGLTLSEHGSKMYVVYLPSKKVKEDAVPPRKISMIKIQEMRTLAGISVTHRKIHRPCCPGGRPFSSPTMGALTQHSPQPSPPDRCSVLYGPGPTGSRVSHKLLKEEHLLLGYLFFMCIHLTY